MVILRSIFTHLDPFPRRELPTQPALSTQTSADFVDRSCCVDLLITSDFLSVGKPLYIPWIGL
jgi:hypothetical protein